MINPSWITAEFVKTLSVIADNIFFMWKKNMGLVHWSRPVYGNYNTTSYI